MIPTTSTVNKAIQYKVDHNQPHDVGLFACKRGTKQSLYVNPLRCRTYKNAEQQRIEAQITTHDFLNVVLWIDSTDINKLVDVLSQPFKITEYEINTLIDGHYVPIEAKQDHIIGI